MHRIIIQYAHAQAIRCLRRIAGHEQKQMKYVRQQAKRHDHRD
jgi:hypothetical protein